MVPTGNGSFIKQKDGVCIAPIACFKDQSGEGEDKLCVGAGGLQHHPPLVPVSRFPEFPIRFVPSEASPLRHGTGEDSVPHRDGDRMGMHFQISLFRLTL